MDMNTYKIIELTGTSPDSVEAAVNNAVAKAAHTVRQMRWFEVVETRGTIEGQSVSQWQVTLKVGFTLED
jgi:flavin-binding protein dodecin